MTRPHSKRYAGGTWNAREGLPGGRKRPEQVGEAAPGIAAAAVRASAPAAGGDRASAEGVRIACVLVPALPLQLLIGEHPEWAGQPVAVVQADRPQAQLLWVNEAARRSGVLSGQRYAAALSLCRDLAAGVVEADRIEQGVQRLTRRLTGFSPEVEPCAEEPGLFWLNASGLVPLYPSLETWAQRVRDALAQEGVSSRVVVGFTRFGTEALCRAGPKRRSAGPPPGVMVWSTPDEERAAARRVSVDRLRLEPAVRDQLLRLHVRTLGDFLDLPGGGVRTRYGKDAHRLHRQARGELTTPLAPRALEQPVAKRVQLGYVETDATRLLFLVKRELHDLLARTAERQQALAKLILVFALEDHALLRREVRPAAPTLDAAQILELVHLTLEGTRLPGGAVELALIVEGRAASARQLRLFVEQPRRDLDAALRAFARIRTEFGAAAVVRARLREAHLPEARFTWEPLQDLPLPRVSPSLPSTSAPERPLIRRIRSRPLGLAPRTRHEPDGWLVRGLTHGPVMTKSGPYVVNGGWWARTVHREYAFLTTQRGDVLWTYYDRRRRRWFLQGQVE